MILLQRLGHKGSPAKGSRLGHYPLRMAVRNETSDLGTVQAGDSPNEGWGAASRPAHSALKLELARTLGKNDAPMVNRLRQTS
jgi:hypothetical protein